MSLSKERSVVLSELSEQRDKTKRQIISFQSRVERLKQQLIGIETCINAVGGDAPQRANGSVKQVILDKLKEAGSHGLTVGEAIRSAEERCEGLNPSSISAYLSTFKTDGIVKYADERYYLPEFYPNRIVGEVTYIDTKGVKIVKR